MSSSISAVGKLVSVAFAPQHMDPYTHPASWHVMRALSRSFLSLAIGTYVYASGFSHVCEPIRSRDGSGVGSGVGVAEKDMGAESKESAMGARVPDGRRPIARGRRRGCYTPSGTADFLCVDNQAIRAVNQYRHLYE
jgi:hypothetical protein